MGKCKFKSDWTKERDWIQPVKKDNSIVYCTGCAKAISVTNGKFSLDQHEKCHKNRNGP